MAAQVVRFESDVGPQWGIHSNSAVCALGGDWPTTGAFLTDGDIDAAHAAGELVTPLDELTLLSPVTQDGEYICQGLNISGWSCVTANYRSTLSVRCDISQPSAVFCH